MKPGVIQLNARDNDLRGSIRPLKIKYIHMKYSLLAFSAVMLMAAFPTSHKKPSGGKQTPLNTLSDAEKKEGWKLLFDGKTTNGWHTYGKTTVGSAWKVDDGAIHLDASEKSNYQSKGGGDIVTNGEYENYDLKLEWKISKNGNSGIIFNIREDPKFKESWHTGLEMQVLDNDGHSDGKIHKH